MSAKNREEALLFLKLMAPKITLDPVPNNSEGHPEAFERTIVFNTRKLKPRSLRSKRNSIGSIQKKATHINFPSPSYEAISISAHAS